MNLSAKDLIDQVKVILTTNSGHHSMEDMVTKNALWANKFLTLEESKTLNASMVKSLREKSSDLIVNALKWTTNVTIIMNALLKELANYKKEQQSRKKEF
jgi:hypothetical protein